MSTRGICRGKSCATTKAAAAAVVERMEGRRLLSGSAWQATDGPNDWTQTLSGMEVRYAENALDGRNALLITGTAGDDTITAAADPNVSGRWRLTLNGNVHVVDLPEQARFNMRVGIAGLGGDDTLRLDLPYDLRLRAVGAVMYGGDGNDTLVGGAGAFNSLSGDAGDDHLTGGASSDTLRGGSGADTLLGGDGGDQLWGNLESTYGASDPGDVLDAGGSLTDSENGMRRMPAELPTPGEPQTWSFTVNGIEVRYTRSSSVSFVDPSRLQHQVMVNVYGTEGDDQILITLDENDPTKVNLLLNGGLHCMDADALLVDDHAFVMITVHAEGGDDYVALDADHDFSTLFNSGPGRSTKPLKVIGGQGDDVIIGSAGPDWMEPDNNDGIHDPDGDDLVFGNGGNDTIHGTGGADRFYGGAGNDDIRSYYTIAFPTSVQLTIDDVVAAVGGEGEDFVMGVFNPADEHVALPFLPPAYSPVRHEAGQDVGEDLTSPEVTAGDEGAQAAVHPAAQTGIEPLSGGEEDEDDQLAELA